MDLVMLQTSKSHRKYEHHHENLKNSRDFDVGIIANFFSKFHDGVHARRWWINVWQQHIPDFKARLFDAKSGGGRIDGKR